MGLQSRLNNETLSLLIDEELTVLDIAGARQLTHAGICSALQQLPQLTALDLSFTVFEPQLLTCLPNWCPRLEVVPDTMPLNAHLKFDISHAYHSACHLGVGGFASAFLVDIYDARVA